MQKDVVAHARKHFNCSKIEGVPLENGGSGGSTDSHWEKLFLPNDYLNPTIEHPGIISAFSLKVLEASHWYKANYSMAQDYTWGKNDGCGHFFGDGCPSGREYCPASELDQYTCSQDYISMAKCSSDERFVGKQCSYLRPTGAKYCTLGAAPMFKSSYESFGPHSRCFLHYEKSTQKIKPGCFESYCDKLRVFFKVKGGEP